MGILLSHTDTSDPRSHSRTFRSCLSRSALASFNLTQYLDNTTPFTLFAPTDAALDGKTITADFLQYHIIAGSKTTFAVRPAADSSQRSSLTHPRPCPACVQTGLLQSQLALASNNNAFQQLSFKVENTTKYVATVNSVVLPAPQVLCQQPDLTLGVL